MTAHSPATLDSQASSCGYMMQIRALSSTSSHSPRLKKKASIDQSKTRGGDQAKRPFGFLHPSGPEVHYLFYKAAHAVSAQAGGEAGEPTCGLPWLPSPFLHLASSQAGFQLLLLFPVSRLPYPPLLLCRDWGSGEAQRKVDNFQPAQLWLDLQRPECWETLCKFHGREILIFTLFFFFLSGLSFS